MSGTHVIIIDRYPNPREREEKKRDQVDVWSSTPCTNWTRGFWVVVGVFGFRWFVCLFVCLGVCKELKRLWGGGGYAIGTMID